MRVGLWTPVRGVEKHEEPVGKQGQQLVQVGEPEGDGVVEVPMKEVGHLVSRPGHSPRFPSFPGPK